MASLIGVGLSVMVCRGALASEETEIRARFEQAAASRVAALQMALAHIEDDLGALGAFLENPLWISRAEFRTLASEMRRRQGYTSALEWVPRVPAAERDVVEREARSEGSRAFQITEERAPGVMERAGARGAYFPVFFVEPLQGHEQVLGFDLASSGVRRDAIERASASGEITATARVKLIQDHERRSAILVLRPVRQREEWQRPAEWQPPEASEASRRRAVLGFAVGVYHLDDVVQRVLRPLSGQRVDMELLDADAAPEERLLTTYSGDAAGSGADRPARGPFVFESKLRIADRHWVARCWPGPGAVAAARTWRPWGVLGAGLSIDGLVVGLFAVQAARTSRARRDARRLLWHQRELENEMAQRRQAEGALLESERLFRGLAENSPVGVYLIRRDLFQYVNPTIASMAGYALNEIVERMGPRAFVHPRDWRRVVREVRSHRDEGRLHLEFTIRTRDGSPRLVETFAVPASIDGKPVLVGTVVDVTDRRRLAEEREQQRRDEVLRRLTASSPLPMVVSQGLDGKVVLMNDKFQELFGYSPGEIPDMAAWERVAFPHEAHRRTFQRAWRERFEARSAEAGWGPLEEAVTCKDGTVRSVMLHGAFADGLQLIVFVDLTDRKRTEQAIRESEQRLSLLVQQSPLGVISWSPHGQVVAWNPAAERIFGYAAAEVIGSHFSLFVPEARRLAVHWERLLAAQLESWFVTKDGRRIWCEWHNAGLSDEGGKLVGVVSLVMDVTEKKKTENDRRKLWTAVEQSPATVIITNTDGCIEYVNPSFERTTGYTSREALGKRTSMLRSHVESDPAVYATISAGRTWQGEMCNRKKSGELFWELVSISPVRDEQGEITHYVGLREDITARKQAALELERAKDQAEAANRAKSAFLASMSHEIRTPLNAILGYSQLTARDPGLSPETRQNLDVINRSGEHLLALINDVLEMSKIEAGRATLQLVAFDLHAMLADLEAMFQLRARSKRLSFEVRREHAVPAFVTADEGKVRQVLVNLLGNAVKFTQAGGVRLTVSARRSASGARIVAEVSDTGVGIHEDEMERLFRDFEQTQSGRALGSGTGLGLAISRGFARLMGGDITVASSPGVGSTFSFEFPVEPCVPEGRRVRRDRRRVLGLESARPPPRVLLADDEATNRGWLAQMLQMIGFQVTEVADGKAAVEAWRAGRPELVLMDIRMPILDGCGATRAIRSDAAGDVQPVIVALTASGVGEERDAMLASGADAIVGKPVRESDLLQIIGERLGLEYRYAEDTPAASAPAPQGPPEPLTRQLVGALPAPTRSAMRDAVRKGDLEGLQAIIDEVRSMDEPLARRISAVAERFEYEALLRVLAGAPSVE